MALNAAQVREVLAAVGRLIEKIRPAADIRHQVDYRADISGSTVTLVAMRPRYDDQSVILDLPFARVRWVGTQKEWRMYWLRADLKWHRYEPSVDVHSINDAMTEIERDPMGCFFG